MQPLGEHDIADGVVPRFRAVVENRPDAVAVHDATSSLTFRELAAEAARARAAARTGGGDEPVAMLMAHAPAAVATVLGVVASGRPLLVLDPKTPPARLRAFTEQVGTAVCLTDEPNEAAARAALGPGGTVIRIDRAPAARPEDLWADPPDPGSIATVAFTSGSTGRPKVVDLDHRQLVSDAWVNSTWSDCYGAGDVMAHTLPMAFNAGLMVTLAGPMVGATMALYDTRSRGIAGLAGWLAESGAAVMHASPAILRAFVQSGPRPEQLATVRSLTIAGEPAHGRDVEAARRLMPQVTVFNRYGSSETGLISEFRYLPTDPEFDGALPAGVPVGGTTLSILAEDGTELPRGEAGIVAVTRRTMGLRYRDAPEVSARTFSLDEATGLRTCRTNDVGRIDEHGRLRLLGRRDHSVKIRGYLVEPGEVDAALFALPTVREAVVVGAPRPADGVLRLVAYVVPAVEDLGAADVRAALRETLPGHMVPEAVVFLEALPRTDRGKLDRSALPEPPAVVHGSRGQEFTDWERFVADAWRRVLSLEDVGLDDDFFELGGDSLRAETLMSIMVDEFGVPAETASTSVLIQAPTVRRFAQELTRRPEPGQDVLVPLQTGGSRTPLFVMAGGGGLAVAFVGLGRHLGPDQPLYGLQAKALERRGLPDWSVRAIARRNIREIRKVQPEGPYRIGGHSFGGLVAMEMAHQLRAAGHGVELLVLLDSFPPDPDLLPSQRRAPRERAKELLAVALTGLWGDGTENFWRFHRQSDYLHRRYRTTPWGGRTLVLLAQSPEREARDRWHGHLTGEWRQVDVSGDHLSMLREPFVAETAKALAEELDALEERRPRDQTAVYPPSMTSTEPVTNDDAGVAR